MRIKLSFFTVLLIAAVLFFSYTPNRKEGSSQVKVAQLDSANTKKVRNDLVAESSKKVSEEKSRQAIQDQHPANQSYRILDYTWIKDAENNAKFINKYSRHEMEKKRLEVHNKFVHRRSMVELSEPFRDLVKDFVSDPSAESLTLPAFDGKEYEVVVTERDGVTSISGTLRGHLAGDPGSNVVVTYYEGSSSAVVKSNEKNTFVDYSAYDDGRVIMNDVHEHELVSQHNCSHCNNH